MTTTTFRYAGDAIVAEYVNGTLTREYITDDAGTIQKVIVPSGGSAGTYLVTWNGHGDAMALHRIETNGSLTLANSYTYSTWGTPNTATHNSIADLGFRFLYVGEYDVQWDDQLGLGLTYMHARHYSPSLGRFLQPDPSRLDSQLFGYTANAPVSRVDPDGQCFWFLLPAATGIGALAAAPSFAVCVVATAGFSYFAARTVVMARDLYNDYKYDRPLGPPDYSGVKVLRTDRKLTPREVKKLEDYLGEDAEHIKTPGGRGAGKYDLWVRPNGTIIVKPKSGKGNGDPVGATLRDINRRGGR